MNKLLLLFLSLLFFGTSFAQPDGLLEETWYLRKILVDGEFSYAPYTGNFNISFESDNSQIVSNANGSQNVLSANVVFNDANETLVFSNVSVTLLDCTDENCEAEDLYFYEVLSDINLSEKEFEYSYFEFNSGFKSFSLTDEFGNSVRYYNTPIQPPSEILFQTWYLHSMDADLGPTNYIANYSPTLQPTIEIDEDLSFSGVGSCNTFTGSFQYDYDDFFGQFLVPENFEATNETCNFHNSFEESYFINFSNEEPLRIWYSEDSNTGEAYFSFELYPGFTYNFKNFPVLSNPDNSLESFSISPNPVSQTLFIKDIKAPIFSISVLDIHGRTLQYENNLLTSLDVSTLPAGVYFVSIVSEGKIGVEKFVKK